MATDRGGFLLDSRRDGSPFLNLLMIAPLTDSRGQIRYFIGAQVDVSGVAKDCTDLESLQKLVEEENERDARPESRKLDDCEPKKPEIQQLSEVLNLQELDTVRRFGGWLHRDPEEDESASNGGNWQRPRLMLAEPSPDANRTNQVPSPHVSGKLSGVYQNV